MRLRCKKEDLVKALNKVGGVASDKTPMTILSYLLMQTKGNKLRIVATDLKIGIETFLDVQVDEEGEVACQAKKFEAVIKELPEKDVAIDTQKNNSILINSGSSHFKLMGMGTDDFPTLPDIKDEIKIEIDGGEFKEIIKNTSFSISYDERRSILNGIYFKVGEGILKVVATDGRRMAYLCRKMETKKSPIEVIIPANAIRELDRIVEDGPLGILFSEKQVIFCSGATRFVSRLVEGQFPDYEKIIPKTLKYKLGLNREQFLASLKRMALLTGESANAVRFDIGKKKVVVSIVNPELGEAREEIKCEGGEAGTASILFNPFYVIDFLKNNSSESIDFQYNDPLTPAVFKPETHQGNYLYFLMPIRL